jgi:hypothetical protein
MSSEGSVSRWLAGLKAGDPDAAQRLWERYFRRLVGLARLKLHDAPRRAANEEDVALSAFATFCQGVEQGRFPQLDDRDNLWRVLVLLTARKAWRLRRSEGQQKRGGGLAANGVGELDLDALIGPEPTPEFAAQVAEESRQLLGRLGDAELESVALWKMEG